MADDTERGWAIVQYLSHVFAETAEFAAAARTGAGRGMGDNLAWQVLRQRAACWLQHSCMIPGCAGTASNLRRMSVAPAASHTRTPDGRAINRSTPTMGRSARISI